MQETVLIAELTEGTAHLLCKALDDRGIRAEVVRDSYPTSDKCCAVRTQNTLNLYDQRNLKVWIAGFVAARQY